MKSISRRLWMVLFLSFIVFVPSIKTYAAEVTIVVSGWNGNANSGIFDICDPLINPNPPAECQKFYLTDDLIYGPVEADVQNLVTNLLTLQPGNRVNMIGFSHGATLVSRVAQNLSKNQKNPVCIDRLITVDKIDFLYPGGNKVDSTPKNVYKALNIHQSACTDKQVDKTTYLCGPVFGFIYKALCGVTVKGAQEQDDNVTPQVLSEWKLLTSEVKQEENLTCIHQWMEDSPTVRYDMIGFLNEPAGIIGNWDVTINGRICASSMGCENISQNASITFSENNPVIDAHGVLWQDYIDEGYGEVIGKWTRKTCNNIHVEYDRVLLANLQSQTCLEAGYVCDYEITKAYADVVLKADVVSATSSWRGLLTIYDSGGILYKGTITSSGRGTGNRGTTPAGYSSEESLQQQSFNQKYERAHGPITSIIGPATILP